MSTRDDADALTLWLGATRYYLGRMTYAVSNYCELLRREWPNLPERTRNLIQRDVEEEFVRDDNDRAEGRQYKALGHDCDRKEWEKVRMLWQEIDTK